MVTTRGSIPSAYDPSFKKPKLTKKQANKAKIKAQNLKSKKK